MYSFEKYSQNLKNDWFSIANHEVNSCINALDETVLERNSDINIIVYKILENKEKNRIPIAIFVSHNFNFTFKGALKILNAYNGGFFIRKDFIQESSSIKNFFYNSIVLNYFAKKMGFDIINFYPPAQKAIENSELIFINNPIRHCITDNNSMLYMKLDDDFIDKLKKMPRYEIRKGIKFIDQNILLNTKGEDVLNHFLYLDKIKSTRLGIKPVTKDYFEELLKSEFHKVLICLDKKTLKPIGGFVYSLVGNVGDQIYLAGSNVERKNFVNKGLTYLAMEACKEAGAKYFMTGHGYTNGNMVSATTYHRTISTNEVSCGIVRSPISLLGRLYFSLLALKRR